MRKTLLLLYVACYWLIALSGCSIAMSLSGTPEPNFDKIKVGTNRDRVESEFKNPKSSKDLPDGKREVTYEYEMANSPNTGRAWVYFYIDLATIGLAEPILTIIELIQPHDEETQIVYGADERVVEIRGYTPSPVSKVVIDAEAGQEKYIERSPSQKPAATDQPVPTDSR